MTHRLTGGQPWLTGGPAVSGDGSGTVITPRGTTQVVTRSILMIGVRGAVQHLIGGSSWRRVTDGRVAEQIISVQGTVATFGSEPIIGVMMKLSFEAVGKQKDRNALRSGVLIGGWLEMTKLPLSLGRYIIRRTTAVGVLEI
ncbi:hypothetical protein Tco_0852528 [Tanacetum coccineum]